jgi:hypothetical protein
MAAEHETRKEAEWQRLHESEAAARRFANRMQTAMIVMFVLSIMAIGFGIQGWWASWEISADIAANSAPGSGSQTELLPDISAVLSITALLGLVGSMLWLAERISAPYPALLAVVGLAIGALANLPFNYQLRGIVGDIVDYLANVQFSAGSLYLFLPALLFNAALQVDLRQIGEEVASISRQ